MAYVRCIDKQGRRCTYFEPLEGEQYVGRCNAKHPGGKHPRVLAHRRRSCDKHKL